MSRGTIAAVEVGKLDPGARYLGSRQCQFVVWAPKAQDIGVELVSEGAEPVPMRAEGNGYFRLVLDGIAPGARYRYRLGDKLRPDPASRYQPEGVHGRSEVIDPEFPWTDGAWSRRPLREFVIYELHVGTFSTRGTFESVIPYLAGLKELGITAIELMPVAQFPGERNWGYDGVFPYAAQNSYGGPRGLKTLINAAHRTGLAVVLDVVYNHLGPEGNYLSDFGPYFTRRYQTPWGDALNFDGEDSDEVRRFFVENAVEWVRDYHVDALRLDAIHAIVDTSARPFLRELSDAVHAVGASLIAESDKNDVNAIRRDGLSCDALWNDDLHHALHVLLTGERDGYYQDYDGAGDLARSYSGAFVYSGQYSRFRRRRHGNSARGTCGERFVVCAQNHDQIGNRAAGDRLSTLVDFESLKLAAGASILSPFVPLLFMGEDYGETAPFAYFTSHGDPELVRAVREGRKREFANFTSQGVSPDPQDEATFLAAKLTPEEKWKPSQGILREYYRELLRIRRETLALANLEMERSEAIALDDETLLVRRWLGESETLLIFNFSHGVRELSVPCRGRWEKVLYSADPIWNGAGVVPAVLSGECAVALMPRSLALYEHL